MFLRSRSFVRRAAVLVVALLLAVPATALFARFTVHFAAAFDLSGAPGGPLQADVGQISVMAPPTEFLVVPDPEGGGQLKIHDHGTPVQATLLGTFSTPFKGQELNACWTMRASQGYSPLDIRFIDDSDSGMIDLSFGGDGTIIVGGQSVMPYVAGVTYKVALTLINPLIGPDTWAVAVTALDGGTAAGVAAGVLPSNGPLTVKAVKLIRPAGAPPGQFFVDDLKAVSSSFSFK